MTTKLLIRRAIFAPFTALHALVLYLRHFAYDKGFLKSSLGEIPTLVLGNIHAGGTGKTPHASAFLDILSKKLGGPQYVALLSRGYMRSSNGFKWVDIDSTSEDVGDEPVLLKSLHLNNPIAVCKDRHEGLSEIHRIHPEVRVVILDDGLQYRALIPHASVLLLDSDRPLEQSALIPGGQLRDLKSRINHFDAWIITRSKFGTQIHLQSEKHPTTFQTYIVDGLPIKHPSDVEFKLKKPRVLAVSGIAYPERFMDGLVKDWSVIRRKSYSDHYRYQSKDIYNWVACVKSEKLDAIITTAKDAVRIKPFFEDLKGTPLVIIPMSIKWHNQDAIELWVDEWLQSPIFAQLKEPQ